MNTEPTPTLAAVAPATSCSRLARCSVCGKITDTWDRYGCFFLEEEYPQECIYVCSTPCFDTAEAKIKSGQWKTPKLKKALGGAAHDISKPRKGYDAQPSQAELVKALIHTANSTVSRKTSELS
jgi:hypothetical protein